MAEYLSKYTGQNIDQLLDAIPTKINKADIVDVLTVGDSQSPASSRLTYLLYNSYQDLSDILTNKVLRTDGSEQTVNGKKKFQTIIDANGGINVPTTKMITVVDEPTVAFGVVNLSMLKKHGVSEDSFAVGSGLKGALLSNGYYSLSFDATVLASHSLDTIPDTVVVGVGTDSKTWTFENLFTKIFADNRFSGYVTVSDYTTDMLGVQGQISTLTTNVNSKVSTTTYNTKMTSLDSSISSLNTSVANLGTNKVDVSVYNTKMTSLDSSISSLNTSVTNLGTGKVDVTTYTTKMTSLDASISSLTSNKVAYAKTNLSGITISASGSTALPDFDMANLCQVLITAKWGSLVDTYRVTMTYDGTVKTELLIQKSTAGTVSFAGSVVSGKLRLTITNANTSTAASVDYSLRASF